MSLQEIIDGYNEEAKREEAHQLSDEGPMAEFVESFYYGELDLRSFLDQADLSEEIKSELKRYAKKHSLSKMFDLVRKHSSLEQTGIYIQSGEVCSSAIGEVECQPSDELLEAYLALSPENQEKVRKSANVYISDSSCKGWMYIGLDMNRQVLVCDEYSLREELGIKAA